MRFKSKRIILVFALVVLFIICSWGVVYASAERMLEYYPASGETIADDRPELSAKWLNIPGVHIKTIRVEIDGKPQRVPIPRHGTDFSWRPTTRLAQGKHTVRAGLTYGLGLSRKVKAEWSFKVDTEPPPIGLPDGASFYVASGPQAAIIFKSEPEVDIDIALNNRSLGSMAADSQGELKIDLNGLKKRNILRLAAKDTVGNVRSAVFPVIKDETTPTIKTMKPAEGETTRTVAPAIDVVFKEEESGLKSIKLIIDGREAVVKGNDGSKRITYLGDLLGDGKHTVGLEATDYAGRSLKKEWSFVVDTRRVVVNRGERRLYYYRNGDPRRIYGVAVGMPAWPTPSGRFRIVNKQINPSWYNPGSAWATTMPKQIPPGTENPLGVRAMALNVGGILIHGTSNYGSIGRAVSHGCIRMRNSDIVGFYPLLDAGVPVDIY